MKIDDYMPNYQFSEFHKVNVEASPEIVSVRFKLLFWVRGFYSRKKPIVSSVGLELILKDLTEKAGFILLDQIPNKEMILGRVGRFWRPSGGIITMPIDQVITFNSNGFVKVICNFVFRKERGEVRYYLLKPEFKPMGM